jgi:small subunit ribosomal protein S20
MANHKSAEKRNRQNEKKRLRNRMARSAVRTAIKKARQAVSSGASDAQDLIKLAEKKLQSVASKGLYHKKNASRRISRLVTRAK